MKELTQQHAPIALTMSDGSVAIMRFLTLGRGSSPPTGGAWFDEHGRWWARPATDELVAAEIARAFPGYSDAGQTLPTCVSWRRITDAYLPTEREYRDAWADTGKAIEHDMPRARAVHLERVRHARAPRLEQLDREWMRATGRGDKKSADAAESARQRLRDLPATIGVEACASIEELRALGYGE
jgi:hypothetical protein